MIKLQRYYALTSLTIVDIILSFGSFKTSRRYKKLKQITNHIYLGMQRNMGKL